MMDLKEEPIEDNLEQEKPSIKDSGEGEGVKEETKNQQQQQDWFSVGASWGSNWLKSAKEKTFTTLELVKKDLTEFSDAVASEASAIAATTVESVKHQAQNLQQIVNPEVETKESQPPAAEALPPEPEEMKENEKTTEMDTGGSGFGLGWTSKLPQMSQISNNSWVKSFVDTVKSIAQEDTTADEDENTEMIPPRLTSDQPSMTRNISHHLLYSIQTDKNTYLNDPDGDPHLFSIWQDDFDITDYDHQINDLLRNCPPMRALYQELVPAQISNSTFWEHYFYKVYQSEMIERYKMVAESEPLEVITKPPQNNEKEKEPVASENQCKPAVEGEQKGQCSPDRRSNTDETWSVCSSTNIEIQEIHDDSEEGRVTPRPADVDSSKSSSGSEPKTEKAADGWVNWEE